jgi:hypothetical protein
LVGDEDYGLKKFTSTIDVEEFYLKNGYKRVGELENYWFGHSKFFLIKNLG